METSVELVKGSEIGDGQVEPFRPVDFIRPENTAYQDSLALFFQNPSPFAGRFVDAELEMMVTQTVGTYDTHGDKGKAIFLEQRRLLLEKLIVLKLFSEFHRLTDKSVFNFTHQLLRLFDCEVQREPSAEGYTLKHSRRYDPKSGERRHRLFSLVLESSESGAHCLKFNGLYEEKTYVNFYRVSGLNDSELLRDFLTELRESTRYNGGTFGSTFYDSTFANMLLGFVKKKLALEMVELSQKITRYPFDFAEKYPKVFWSLCLISIPLSIIHVVGTLLLALVSSIAIAVTILALDLILTPMEYLFIAFPRYLYYASIAREHEQLVDTFERIGLILNSLGSPAPASSSSDGAETSSPSNQGLSFRGH